MEIFRPFRVVTYLIQTFVSISFLVIVLAVAISVDVRRRIRTHSFYSFAKHAVNRWRANVKTYDVPSLIEREGYDVEVHEVETEDGFILGVQRIVMKTARLKRGVVILQHGLFQTSLPFLINKGHDQALAFLLATQGWDVWLGNNRGNLYSRKHKRLQSSDDKFWDWCIDDMRLDVMASVNYVLRATDVKKLAYIGHSQGAAQGLMALSRSNQLQEKISLFVAMSPGVFVQPFPSRPLRSLAWLFGFSPRMYYAVFGQGMFLPFMETVRKIVPTQVYSYFAFCMFKHLMHWGDDNWNKKDKPQYFSEAPAGSSTRTLAHWLQQSLTGKFAMYDFGNPAENRKHYGQSEAPGYSLKNILTPVAVISGGLDTLLDYKKLISLLPSCVYQKIILHHAHLDNLMATDAHELVYPDIRKLLEQYNMDTSPKLSYSHQEDSEEEKHSLPQETNGTKNSKISNGH